MIPERFQKIKAVLSWHQPRKRERGLTVVAGNIHTQHKSPALIRIYICDVKCDSIDPQNK